MMMKKQMVILLTSLSLFLIQLNVAAAEAPPQDTRLTYTTSFTGTDTALKGSSAQQQYFEVMDYWNVDEIRINLHFQISQITKEQISSVTLTLNGSPFYTFRPSLKDNGEQQLVLQAPKGFLKKEPIRLEFRAICSRTIQMNNLVLSIMILIIGCICLIHPVLA